MDTAGSPTPPRRRILGLLLAATLFGPPAARAQAPAETAYDRRPGVRVPFTRDLSGRLKRVKLFVSADQGRDWREVSSADPADGYFPVYTVPADGAYWFAVQAIDFQDQPNPPTLGQLAPQVCVVVDRKPPVVSLKQIADPRPGIVSVEWDARDENLDPRRFALEFRVPPGDWQREPAAQSRPTGTQSWRLEPGTRMEVRLRVGDRAGNDTAESVWVGLTADGRPLDPPAAGAGGNTTSSSRLEPDYVKSTQISLQYTIEKMPLSGIPVFELWYTKNRGQTWNKVPKRGGSPTDLPASPGAPATLGRLEFDADGQGEYGFIVVARNGVGIGTPDPKPGDPPTRRVVVDTETPTVTLKATRGQGYEVREVRIEWSANDLNLTDKPVTVEFAEVKDNTTPPAEADWKPIERLTGPLDKAGVHTWTVGPNGPFRFHIRAKAADKAGNVGLDQTKEPILVDLERPAVIIGGIGPAGEKPPER